MLSCPNGHQNAGTSIFCVECGAPLASTPPPAANRPTGSASGGLLRSTRVRVGTALAGIALLAIIGGLLIVSAGGKKANSANTIAPVAARQATTQGAPATQAALATVTVATVQPTAATASATVIPTASPTPSPSPSPTPSPTPAPTPVPAGTVLYQSDWSTSANGWPETLGWRWYRGTYINDGSSDGSWLRVPVGLNEVADYAIEADIEFTPSECTSFGLVARNGYRAAFTVDSVCNNSVRLTFSKTPDDHDCCSFNQLAGHSIGENDYKSLVQGRHIYRLEVSGMDETFLVDGNVVLQTRDSRFLTGGAAWIWSKKTQMTLYSFKVIKL